MKNWKKLLACLLVGLMALTVFTACDASVGAPMGPKRSNAESESVKALCTKFGVTYDKELSEKAYYIAYWVAGTSVSCSTNANKTELYRVGNANDITKTSLLQHKYATAFESMGMGVYGSDEDFVPGFYIDTDLDSRKDYIRFVLPKVGIYPEAMTTAAKVQKLITRNGMCRRLKVSARMYVCSVTFSWRGRWEPLASTRISTTKSSEFRRCSSRNRSAF